MSGLPCGWALATVGEIAELADGPFGSNLKTAHYTPEGPRVVRLQNVGDGVFRDERAHISQAHYERLLKHSVREGDVIVASLGEMAPRACRVPSRLGPAIVKADCIRVRPAAGVESSFLMWMLNSPPVRGQAAASIKGIGRPRLGLGGIQRLTVPIPPTAEQRRIVAAIEEHFSRLDAADVSLRVAEARLAILRARAVDRNFESARTWVSVGDVAEVRGGIQKQPKRRPLTNTAPFLRVANVLKGRLDLTDVHKVELFEGERERYRLQPGDLLVVEGNGSIDQIGRSAVWRGEIDDCVHQNHLIRVRPDQSVVPEFLGVYWNSTVARRRLTEVASSTSGLYTLSTAKVKAVPVPLPPHNEQHRIVAEVERHLSLVDALAAAIDTALARSAALRRSILEQAFTGKLVPQDPSDEPASVLLERIRSERAATPPKRRATMKTP